MECIVYSVYKNLTEGAKRTLKLFSREPRERTRVNGHKLKSKNSTRNTRKNLTFLPARLVKQVSGGCEVSILGDTQNLAGMVLNNLLYSALLLPQQWAASSPGAPSSLSYSLILRQLRKTSLVPEDPATTCSGLTSAKAHLNLKLCNKTATSYCRSVLAF